MPRCARVDVPGQVYHVMGRGIERRRLFHAEEDYADFRARLALWLGRTGSKCLAWCLMPNHFHILLLRGPRALSEMMHHLLTGYAVGFNVRYHRAGHLFQNRYKAIICDNESYILELVPYIHLNPLRANLTADLAGLARYKWCGHGAAVGLTDGVLDQASLLEHFGGNEEEARGKYMAAMLEKTEKLTGRDVFGDAAEAARDFCAREKIRAEQRALGQEDIAAAVSRVAAQEKPPRTREEVLAAIEAKTGIGRGDILRKTKERNAAFARALYCYFCREDAGVAPVELMRELQLEQSSVSKLISRGRELARAQKKFI
ncbi:MAG: transposase [Elusimicrobiales bacterium]